MGWLSAFLLGKKSQIDHKKLFESAHDAILILSPVDEKILDANPAAYAVYGLSRSQLLGRSMREFTWDHKRAEGVITATLANGHFKFETRQKTVGGGSIWFEINASMTSYKGKPAILSVNRDISARKKAQIRLAALEQCGRLLLSCQDYETALKSVVHLIAPNVADYCSLYALGPVGELRHIELAYYDKTKMTGLKNKLASVCAQVKSPDQFLQSFDHGRGEIISDCQLIGDSIFKRNLELSCIDREVPLRSYLAVPLNRGKQIIGVLSLATTVESDRYLDKDDFTFAQEITIRAKAAIENSDLHTAAAQAIQARNDMIAAVSHDLKNPLSNIMSASELLLREEESGSQKHFRRGLSSISHSADRMNHLIETLVSIQKFEIGNFRLNHKDTSLLAMISEAQSQIELSARSKNIAIEFDSENMENITVTCDREQIYRVLSNLLGNAIKFSGSGSTIRIAADEDENAVTICIQDEGDGIDKKDIPHIFDRYWQANRNSSLSAGLGLAICKEIIRAHAGDLWVESEKGNGSKFFFTLQKMKDPALNSNHIVY